MGKSLKAKNIVTGEIISLSESLALKPFSNLVLELVP
jgi:hypothetical protein